MHVQAKTCAIAIIWNLATLPANKVILCSPPVGLLRALIFLIVEENNQLITVKACGTLRNLATAPANQTVLANEDGLLQALTKVLLSSDSSAARMKACGAIRVSVHIVNKDNF